MSFLNKLTASLPFGKKEEQPDYFFAVNIGAEKLTAALWTVGSKDLKVLDIASQSYSSNDEIVSVTDKLLDQVLGLKEVEPQKILFGVPNSWIVDDNLKEEYLRVLRHLVKELELTPMAYVSTSNALVHFLEKQEGVPTTAILVGFEEKHLTVTVVRAGKLDGVKVVTRGETSGADIEKALLTFTDVETLPSKILIYGEMAVGLKSQLASFSWMSKLSFLHVPKIEVLGEELEIKSVCLAGGSEINGNVVFVDQPIKKSAERLDILEEGSPEKTEDQKESAEQDLSEDLKSEEQKVEKLEDEEDTESEEETEEEVEEKKKVFEKPHLAGDNFGFMVGDVADKEVGESAEAPAYSLSEERELAIPEEDSIEIDDFEREITPPQPQKGEHKRKFNLKRFIPRNASVLIILFGVVGAMVLAVVAYLFLLKADVKIFVEPKILEKDAQVIADPNQKTVDEEKKIIPGQIVNVDVSGSAKDTATGKRQIGDPAKGMVRIYNATDQQLVLKAGQTLTNDSGVQFKLDKGVEVASKSASAAAPPSQSDAIGATAAIIGADGNIPSSVELKVGNYSKSEVVAKTEGNFSGGTSKDVTVVSSEDQQRLLAKLSSNLRQQAQQKIQEKYPTKKILEEALSESTVKKSYSKNINDQASEFSLNMTVTYKGTAFDDADLKTIVSKLVTTQVPDGFRLDLSDTETQADVSKLEKDGKLVFLAKFKAKLMPKIDTDKIRNQIKFKTLAQAADIIKSVDNILGSEIDITPQLPAILQRLPLLSKNIKIEVGLK
ncbi:MAG: hypothetical protein M1142_02035 [Patescibacteria group bacterium]|nr:hypothetical protein [Patescibacteria group bacterium]